MNLDKLKILIESKRYKMSDHILQRLAARKISRELAIKAVLNGEVIEDYPHDNPFPSCLMLGWIEGKPIHVVVSMDENENVAYFITVYEPSLEKFESDFKKRRK